MCVKVPTGGVSTFHALLKFEHQPKKRCAQLHFAGCVCSLAELLSLISCLPGLFFFFVSLFLFFSLVCQRVGYVTRDRPTPSRRGDADRKRRGGGGRWRVESSGAYSAWLPLLSHRFNDHDASKRRFGLRREHENTRARLLRPPVGKQLAASAKMSTFSIQMNA